ncbi:MAG: hypothetical protein KF777_15790 [Planctomycetaceae bacterium]|nr:hypothetical protein [Planctomycetaceae bacterium]
MHTYTDNTGREWPLRLTYGLVRQVRQATGINLLGLSFEGSIVTDGPLVTCDALRLLDVLWALASTEAARQGIPREDFEESLRGDALESAAVALFEELLDFFPAPSRTALRRYRERVLAARDGRLMEQAEKSHLETLAAIAQALQTPSTSSA